MSDSHTPSGPDAGRTAPQEVIDSLRSAGDKLDLANETVELALSIADTAAERELMTQRHSEGWDENFAGGCLFAASRMSEAGTRITAKRLAEVLERSTLSGMRGFRERLTDGVLTEEEAYGQVRVDYSKDHPWTKKEYLREKLRQGYTIQQIADEHNDATYNTVRRHITEVHGLSPANERGYWGDRVPIAKWQDTIAFPISVEYVDAHEIESGDSIRTMVEFDPVGSDLVFRFQTGPDVTGMLANERKVRADGLINHAYYLIPRRVAFASGHLEPLPDGLAIGEQRRRLQYGPSTDDGQMFADLTSDIGSGSGSGLGEAETADSAVTSEADDSTGTSEFLMVLSEGLDEKSFQGRPEPSGQVWLPLTERPLTDAEANLPVWRSPTLAELKIGAPDSYVPEETEAAEDDARTIDIGDLPSSFGRRLYGSRQGHDALKGANKTVEREDLAKRLNPIWDVPLHEGGSETVDNIAALRLYFPSVYRRAYGIDTSTTFTQRIGAVPTTDGIALGLILYFEDEAIGTLPEKDVSNVYEDKSPGGIAHICYPRKAILNALEIGLTEPSPPVDLVAGPGWIGIFPPLGLTDEIEYEL